MKRIISAILCLALLSGVFTALMGVSVFAEDAGYTTTKYNPVEITLQSSNKYDNPYAEAEIDAVFTFSDGTEKTVPGFWKEEDTWAVRFTPDKVGKWSFTITCSDTTNTGLHNVTGVVECTENDGSSNTEKHGFIKVSDSKRYFTYEDGTPFFWLGDTNWQAPNYIQTNNCNYPGCSCGNQFKHEVDDRLAKGFNVYQTYFDSATSDGGGQNGILPSIWKKKHTMPSTAVYNEKIDYMFKYLHDNGMIIALGFGVHSNTMQNISEENYLRFVRYVVARYSCYSVVWITGQEVTDDNPASATPGKKVYDIYIAGQRLVDKLDCYKHPNGTHMYPLDPKDNRAMVYDRESWHTWWAVQGGHGASIRAKSFYQKYYMNASGTVKPYIETEANYEDINCGGFTGYNASRYSAWNGVLNGSVGFTYGVAGIWANCYSTEKNTGWYGMYSYSYEPWYMGLDKPGSFEVGYMKKFFEALPDWTKLIPRFYSSTWSSFSADETMDIAATEDMSTVVCYFQNIGSNKTGKIKMLDKTKAYKGYWFNPLTGKYIPVPDADTSSGVYEVPAKPTTGDWVFLLTNEEFTPFATESPYVDVTAPDGNAITGNIITPYSVKAIGGVYYDGGREIDITKYLYDLNGDAAWEPSADRVSQTIIYDLGAAYNLTHLTIMPATDTVLPEYRISVSNDGISWTIMADASLRAARMSSDGKYVSEALTGAYRYVKILLMNAKNISPDKIDSVKYLTVHHVNDNVYYSKTAIAELSVFGTGLAEGVVAPDIDNSNTGNTGNAGNTGNTGNTGTNDGGNGAPVDEGTKLPIALFAVGGAVLGIAVGVVLAIVIKKKKEN